MRLPGFLDRTSNPSLSASGASKVKPQQSQLFITNPITLPRLRQLRVEPTAEEIEVSSGKQAYQALHQQFIELKSSLEKIRCEYREMGRKIKQASITVESEVRKLETCADIDIKFLRKTLLNEPQFPYAFIQSQLSAETEDNRQISEVLQKLNSIVISLEHQIGI